VGLKEDKMGDCQCKGKCKNNSASTEALEFIDTMQNQLDGAAKIIGNLLQENRDLKNQLAYYQSLRYGIGDEPIPPGKERERIEPNWRNRSTLEQLG